MRHAMAGNEPETWRCAYCGVDDQPFDRKGSTPIHQRCNTCDMVNDVSGIMPVIPSRRQREAPIQLAVDEGIMGSAGPNDPTAPAPILKLDCQGWALAEDDLTKEPVLYNESLGVHYSLSTIKKKEERETEARRLFELIMDAIFSEGDAGMATLRRRIDAWLKG